MAHGTTQMAFGWTNLFFAGLLAGEELVICYGLRSALSILDTSSHILLRQRLIRRLRILVPILLLLALFSGVLLAIWEDHGLHLVARCAGLAFLGIFLLLTLTGTAPINQVR